VREALRKLQAQHLVVVVPNRGAKVRVPSRGELIEVYRVRAELEGFASELAAGLAGPDTFAALDAAQARIDEAVAELEAWRFEPDEEPSFHRRLASGNEDFMPRSTAPPTTAVCSGSSTTCRASSPRTTSGARCTRRRSCAR
jgi:DNA-binding GntR family transcriptional regulator